MKMGLTKEEVSLNPGKLTRFKKELYESRHFTKWVSIQLSVLWPVALENEGYIPGTLGVHKSPPRNGTLVTNRVEQA